MLDDGAAFLRELGCEGIRDALAEGLRVIDDVDGLLAEDLEDVLGAGRTLDVVRGHDADVVVRLGPELLGGIALGQVRVRVGRRALEQAAVVRDRDLGLGNARVERADQGDDAGVVDRRLHVLGARLGIVGAVQRVVEDRVDRQRVAIEATGRVGFLDRQLDAVDDRIRRRLVAPLERKIDRDLQGLAARP